MATFLGRADHIDLHAVSVTEVERSFTETFASADMTLTAQLAGTVRKPPGIYPFLSNDGLLLVAGSRKTHQTA
ncbi:hypothetical protein R5O87_17060 [Arthrobacter globiformis]|uniref:hypothetical protein n=1 Tax=Arthrobacter globiformis TaxID=1665 RepID=UPI00397C5EF1